MWFKADQSTATSGLLLHVRQGPPGCNQDSLEHLTPCKIISETCRNHYVTRTGYVQNSMVKSITPLLHTAPQRITGVEAFQHCIS